MDFLEIRKKAKERAQARAAEEAEARVRAAAASGPGPGPAEKPSTSTTTSTTPAATPTAPATPTPFSIPGPGPGWDLASSVDDTGFPPDAGAVVTDEDLIEGALAARLQGLPSPEPLGAAGHDDARFTTWRPGTTAAPFVEPGVPLGGTGEPRPEDFAVIAPGSLPAPSQRPAPVAAPPEEEAEEAPADPLDEFFYRPDETAPALPQLAPAATPFEDLAPAPMLREEYVTFRLDAEEYAVAIERVREVIKAPPVTEVPRAPAHILGVVTVRGEVVAVVDPRRRLGLQAAAPATASKIVIVDSGDGPCGLLVDRITSVVRLRPGSIEPCPQGIAGEHAEYLAGIGREGDRLFTVLDLGALLRRVAPREGRRADGGA
jgi:purine-binding chemotaxis protein CheW